MIVGRKSDPVNEHFLIGLTDENIGEMQQGKTIHIGPLPIDGTMRMFNITLLHGNTEQQITDTLKTAGLFSEETDGK